MSLPDSKKPILLTGEFSEVAQCRHGLMLYNKNDMCVGRSLQKYGEFSEREIDLFRDLVGPGGVVVEAGANIGAHTLFLSQSVGTDGIVFAYEPQRLVFPMNRKSAFPV
jgi:hypothetical protein